MPSVSRQSPNKSVERRAFEVTRTVMDAPDDEDALSQIAELAKTLVSARDVYVFVLGSDSKLRIAVATTEKTVRAAELGQILEAANEKLDEHATRQTGAKIPDTDETVPLDLVAKVLADRARVHAVLVVVRDPPNFFSRAERRDFSLLAEHAANGLTRRTAETGSLNLPLLGPPQPRRDAATEARYQKLKTDRFSRPAAAVADAAEALMGTSPKMRETRNLVRAFAPAPDPVLIQGETGTGKELVARGVHALSPRRDAPFVAVNCAAQPKDMVESLFFGHVKGAFTGADKPADGYFRAADGGTLFLDEVGELDERVQAKLLRALEHGEVTPVGATRPIKVDVRIVSATNRDLAAFIREGRFREDLFQRLCVLDIFLPPLRDRLEDIPLLIVKFLGELANEGRPRRIAKAALAALQEGVWRGNVRELRAKIRRAANFTEDEIAVEHLSLERRPIALGAGELERAERDVIVRALAANNGNKTLTAQALEIDRGTLRDRMKKHGLT